MNTEALNQQNHDIRTSYQQKLDKINSGPGWTQQAVEEAAVGEQPQAPEKVERTGIIEGLVEGKDYEIVDKATNSISKDTVWEEVKVYDSSGKPTDTKVFFTNEDAWVTGTNIKNVTHEGMNANETIDEYFGENAPEEPIFEEPLTAEELQ